MKAIVLHEYAPASKLTYEDFEGPKPAAGEVSTQSKTYTNLFLRDIDNSVPGA